MTFLMRTPSDPRILMNRFWDLGFASFPVTRREHLTAMLGLPGLAAGLFASPPPGRDGAFQPTAGRQERPVPAAGIGHRIRHLSYSDMAGRPDSVQVMLN